MSKISLKDYTKSPDPVPTLVEKAKKTLAEKAEGFYGNTNFAVISEDADPSFTFGRACHADAPRLSNMAKDRGGPFVIATSTTGRTNLNKTLATPFAKWFIKKSIFSQFILNRDDEISDILNSGIVVATDIPRMFVQTILIISRHFSECGNFAFKSFNKWTEKGLSPESAYALCFNSTLSEIDSNENTVLAQRISSGHRAWTLFNLTCLKQFKNKEILYSSDTPTYRESPTISGVTSLFSNEGKSFGQSVLDVPELQKALSLFRKKKTSSEKYVPPNPFSPLHRPPPPPTSFSLEEFEEVILPWLIKEGY